MLNQKGVLFMKANDFAYKNKSGKGVYGAAAFNHYVFKSCKGIDGFISKHATHIFTLPLEILSNIFRG